MYKEARERANTYTLASTRFLYFFFSRDFEIARFSHWAIAPRRALGLARFGARSSRARASARTAGGRALSIGGKKEPGVLKLTPRHARLSREPRTRRRRRPFTHGEITRTCILPSTSLVNLRTIDFPVENLTYSGDDTFPFVFFREKDRWTDR